MRGGCRFGTLWLGLALAVGLPGCGGSSGPGSCPQGTTGVPPNCVPIAPPCTQSTVYSAPVKMNPRTLVYLDFSVPDSGRLDVTLDWTFAASHVGFYLVPANTCTLEEFNKRSCNFMIRSEPSSTKPRKVSQANFAAGNYRWLTGTFDEKQESGSLLIVLSKGTSCPALSFAGTTASSSDDGEPLRMDSVRKE
jgi:hypothetical protein